MHVLMFYCWKILRGGGGGKATRILHIITRVPFLCTPTGKERRERELQEALRKAEEEQRLHQQLEEAAAAQVTYSTLEL